MDSQIIAIYCLCDDLLRALHHYEDRQRQMSDAEVLTTALVAALYFRGNFETARDLLAEPRYIPTMLSKSRFNRRLHDLADVCWSVFHLLGETWQALNTEALYVIDSFPIAACDNYRIGRSRRYRGEVWRGYQASKRRYFYGLKLHLLITASGQPVEFFLTPGRVSDTRALKMYEFDVADEAWITADKMYTDYEVEDCLATAGCHLSPLRKHNSKRPVPPWMTYLQSTRRHIIETTGSRIERLLPKSIHAVTARGFELIVGLLVIAPSLDFMLA